MEEEQKQLIYISGNNIDNNIIEEQKKYIKDNLNHDCINSYFVKFQGFFYTGFTSFSKPIAITCTEYNNFINYFENFKISNFLQNEKKFDKSNFFLICVKPKFLDFQNFENLDKNKEIKKLFNNNNNIELSDIKNIKNNKLLKHKLLNIHKTELVKYLKENKKIYLLDTNYKDLIINNQLPYLDYDDLKQDLKFLYKDENFEKAREGEKKIVFDKLIKAVTYAKELSDKKINFVLLVIDKNLFLIYHPDTDEDIDIVDVEDKKGENYKEIIEFLFGDEMENIIHKKLPLTDEENNVRNFDFINGLDNYIIDNINPEHKISLNGHTNTRNKNIKVSNNEIDFDIVYQYKNLCQILIKHKDKEIKLKEDFYMPEGETNLDKMANSLNLLWIGGHLMSDYDYNYYAKYDIILFNDIRLPKWFRSGDNEDMDKLFRFIEQLN